jgi:hypothetical protein
LGIYVVQIAAASPQAAEATEFTGTGSKILEKAGVVLKSFVENA